MNRDEKGRFAAKLTEGFKGFDLSGCCVNKKYEPGHTYTVESKAPLVCCTNTGLHFCTKPEDVWSYYGPHRGKYATVTAHGKCDGWGDDSKRATKKLTVGGVFYDAFQYARNFFKRIKANYKSCMGSVYTESGYATEQGEATTIVGVGTNQCFENFQVLASTACSAIYGAKLAFAAGPHNLVQSEKLAIAVGGRAYASMAGAAAVTTELASGVQGSTLVFLKEIWPVRYKVYQFPVDGEKARANTIYGCSECGDLYEIR